MARHSEWLNSALVGKDGFCRTSFAPALFAQDYYGCFEHFTPSLLVDTTHYPGFVVTVLTDGTLAMADAKAGVLDLVGGANNGEGIQMQGKGECFLPAANKDIFFECQIAATDADDIDWFVGLSKTDLDVFTVQPAALIAFLGDDGDADIDFQVRDAGAGAQADTTVNLANGTAIRLGFWVKGVTSVVPYINGVAYAAVAANIPTEELCLTFGMLNGGTTANNVLALDWFRVLQFA